MASTRRAPASLTRIDLVVHRSGDIGSPLVTGSISESSVAQQSRVVGLGLLAAAAGATGPPGQERSRLGL